MIRVFLVDDSAFVRRALSRVLAMEPGFRIVGEAAGGAEALARIPAADPDLVTLDVAMPGMDGLQVLPALLRWKPSLKVLMLSAHTQEGATATVAALAAGAVDFIDKTRFNVMDLEYLRREVVDRMKALAPARGGPAAAPTAGPRRGRRHRSWRAASCASSGPPPVVLRRCSASWRTLPARFPMPVVVVQHMPVGFTGPFADRLATLSRVRVAEAEEGMRLVPGVALIAPAGQHLRVSSNLGGGADARAERREAHSERGRDHAHRRAFAAGQGARHPAHRHGRGRRGRHGDDPRRRRSDDRGERIELRGLRHATRGVQRGGAAWVLPLPGIAALLGGCARGSGLQLVDGRRDPAASSRGRRPRSARAMISGVS